MFIAADAYESCIVGCDSDVKHLVRVACVRLDQAGCALACWYGRRSGGCGCFGGIVEAHEAISRASQNLHMSVSHIVVQVAAKGRLGRSTYCASAEEYVRACTGPGDIQYGFKLEIKVQFTIMTN
jgi:hypothetical protein